MADSSRKDGSEQGLETGAEKGWLLLAEDDALFASLFCRFFQKRYGDRFEIRVVKSLSQARLSLAQSVTAPCFAVLDLNLEDGSSEEMVGLLGCDYLLWSASPENGMHPKPSGRPALEAAVDEIATLAEGQGSPLE